MIVCQCTGITSGEIKATIEWMRASDPSTIITAGKIYRALGKRADCGGCLPLFMKTMESSTKLGVPANLQGLRIVENKKEITRCKVMRK